MENLDGGITVYDFRMLKGIWIKDAEERMFFSLGGDEEQYRLWFGRSRFEYYRFLEKRKALNQELTKKK